MKSVRRLARRRTARHDAGLFLIDGPVLLRDALAAGIEILDVYVESAERAESLRAELAPGIGVRELRAGTLAKVLDVVHPNELVAVARMPSKSSDRILAGVAASAGLALALVDVSDPGNVGTLIRSAVAVGAAAVVIAGECADPYSPKVVRAAAGALFHVPVVVEADALAGLRTLRQEGITTLGAIVSNGMRYDEVDMAGPIAIVIGNEAHGLSTEQVDECSQSVSIPIDGRVESLNAAMAGTVLLFEAARQRR